MYVQIFRKTTPIFDMVTMFSHLSVRSCILGGRELLMKSRSV
jgi:hypothetical protein